jgi:hypothetical protein
VTQDEIIDMAQECGLIGMRPHLDGIYSEALVAFAKLIAAKEREECADLLEFGYIDEENHHLQYAYEIRARGEQA